MVNSVNTAMGTTTYGDISQRTAAWAVTEMLAHAEPCLVLQKFGLTKEMPKNVADNAKFRRPIPFPAATVPLTEGVTPTAQKMAYEDVPVQLRQYGRPVEITDYVEDLSEDPVLRDASMLCGEQAGNTVEQVTYGVLKAGTSAFYANGTVRTSVNTAITLAKQRAVTRFLKAQKAKKITMILDGSPKYMTRAIEASYVACTHTDCESDIRGLSGFVPTASYGSRSTVSEHEIGAVEDVRYVLSADLAPFTDAGNTTLNGMVSTLGNRADVYPMLFFGREAFGLVPLKGMRSITPTVVNRKPSAADPMAQRAYVSWKTYFNAVILNDNWMSRLEVAVTAL